MKQKQNKKTDLTLYEHLFLATPNLALQKKFRGPIYHQQTPVPSDTNTPGGAAQRNFSRNGRSEVPVAKRRRTKKPQAMIVSMADTVFFIP